MVSAVTMSLLQIFDIRKFKDVYIFGWYRIVGVYRE